MNENKTDLLQPIVDDMVQCFENNGSSMSVRYPTISTEILNNRHVVMEIKVLIKRKL